MRSGPQPLGWRPVVLLLDSVLAADSLVWPAGRISTRRSAAQGWAYLSSLGAYGPFRAHQKIDQSEASPHKKYRSHRDRDGIRDGVQCTQRSLRGRALHTEI